MLTISSRVAKTAIKLPPQVHVQIEDRLVKIKGPKGEFVYCLPDVIELQEHNHDLQVTWKPSNVLTRSKLKKRSTPNALSGTIRAILNNGVHGVTEGFEKSLVLVGVGYRAQLQGSVLLLSLGFSHVVEYKIPQGISIVLPSQTEIKIAGVDKELVGRVAAQIREKRAPEPYKGKGICYSDEKVVLKDSKKKK